MVISVVAHEFTIEHKRDCGEFCVKANEALWVLESIYHFIFMDAIHCKVKENQQYITKAAYVALGIRMDGRKDIWGVWISEHEGSRFWLTVFNDLEKPWFTGCLRVLRGWTEPTILQGRKEQTVLHK